MTRYWLDTEFIEDGITIDLISIGIVAEDGREYYAVNEDCGWDGANDWVRENVLAPIGIDFDECDEPIICAELVEHLKSSAEIALDVVRFIKQPLVDLDLNDCDYTKICALELPQQPEIWGYYADYDWVVFCQLFGQMVDLPKGFPMYCRDIKQWCDDLGNPQLPKQKTLNHHALEDARWTRQAWEFLRTHSEDCIVERG